MEPSEVGGGALVQKRFLGGACTITGSISELSATVPEETFLIAVRSTHSEDASSAFNVQGDMYIKNSLPFSSGDRLARGILEELQTGT